MSPDEEEVEGGGVPLFSLEMPLPGRGAKRPLLPRMLPVLLLRGLSRAEVSNVGAVEKSKLRLGIAPPETVETAAEAEEGVRRLAS